MVYGSIQPLADRLLARLRHIPRLAYLFLAFSFVGAIVEVTYHFVPPGAIPAVGSWVAGLSPVDRDFLGLIYELAAHVFIALGLMGMVTVIVYRHMSRADGK